MKHLPHAHLAKWSQLVRCSAATALTGVTLAGIALTGIACGGSPAQPQTQPSDDEPGSAAQPDAATQPSAAAPQSGAASQPGAAGAPSSKPGASDAANADAAEAKLPSRAELEASCKGKDGCMPPTPVVERLCSRRDPHFALAMFRKGTPWKRVYTRRALEAWYAQKGRTRPHQLRNAEELIVLVDRTNTGGGVTVSGFSNYDVYRWDGTCVSIMADEVTDLRPSTPDVATINFRQLDDDVQDALLAPKRITFRNDQRKKQCKGDRGSKSCKKATHGLARIIAEHLRDGGTIPLPDQLP